MLISIVLLFHSIGKSTSWGMGRTVRELTDPLFFSSLFVLLAQSLSRRISGENTCGNPWEGGMLWDVCFDFDVLVCLLQLHFYYSLVVM